MVVFVVLVLVSYAPRCSAWVFLVRAVHMTSRYFDAWNKIIMAHSDSEIESTNYQKTFVSVSHLSQVKIVYTSYNIYISMYLYIHIFTCLDIYIFIYLYIHIKKHVFLARDDFLTILPWSCSETNSEALERISLITNLSWKNTLINFMVSCPRDCSRFFWVHDVPF